MGKALKWGFTVLFWLLVVITLAEIVLRQNPNLQSWSEANGKAFASVYDTVLFARSWALARPQGEGEFVVTEFSHSMNVNSQGFRDVEHPVEKGSGEYRLVGLGDSFTEGMGAEFDSTWLQLLAHNLNERVSGKAVYPIVGAVGGSDPYFGYHILKRKLLKYQPDMVLMTLNFTDVNDMKCRGGAERFLPGDKVQFKQPPAVEEWFANSYLIRYVMLNILGYDWFYHSPEEQQEQEEKALELLDEAVSMIKGVADSVGSFQLVLVLHPASFELDKQEYDYNWEPILQHARSQGIPVIDLLPYYAKHLEETQTGVYDYYWPIDGHHKAQGYALFAQSVEQALQDQELLPLFVELADSADVLLMP